MVKLCKIYAFVIPLTQKQFNIGNRYALIKKYEKDKDSGIKIKFISRKKSIHITHDEACILTENSSYNDCIIYTTYLNNHYPSDVFKITVETSLSENNFSKSLDIKYYKYTDLENQLICYKKLTIEINKFMCGWIANEIDKNLLEQYVEHHHIIINTKEEWKKLSYDDIDKLERKTYG
ncbi:hypothetical protein NAPIS_ORF01339 [Vairimorpha apis BRL 01]|uniref:Phosphatidylinositol transfer protein N-terminal domain-containing protein n=1 Tax=Vairimorpha apis BRL 01 TaxID=1037528 RepID=T0L9H8_9MICR|nr:hypothetical protein NAPIS_ORF01339 [Vairimorpha apis BRL 01]